VVPQRQMFPAPRENVDGGDVKPAQRYLFICGCARSGTSALWQLMSSHPGIVLGLERYVRSRKKFSPLLFEKEAFFDVPLENKSRKLQKYYREAQNRFDRAKFVGDKIPKLYLDYGRIEETFPNADIIFVLRNIIDVAGSYERRRQDPEDSWSRDFRVSLHQWQESIDSTLSFLAKGSRTVSIHVVGYEDLWLEPVDIESLFGRLDLSLTPAVKQTYDFLTKQSKQLEAARGDSLTSSARHYIALNAPFESYRELFKSRVVFPGSEERSQMNNTFDKDASASET